MHILYCIASPGKKWAYLDDETDEVEDQIGSAARRQLNHFSDTHLDERDHDVLEETRIAVEHAAPGTLEEADRFDIELIVVRATGASAWNQFLLGSTAEEVIRSADAPVMVVPSSEVSRDSDVARILTPIELSACRRAVLQHTADWAAREDASLSILHVISLPKEAIELMEPPPAEDDQET